jgi:serine protease AprX
MIASSPSRRVVVLCLLCALVAGCAAPRRVSPTKSPYEDDYDRIVLAPLDSMPNFPLTVGGLPAGSYAWKTPAARPAPFPRPPRAHAAAMDSTLKAWVADSAATKIDTLLVSFRSDVKVPRFPNPDLTRPRTDPVNLALLDSAQAIITAVEAARDSQYDADILALTGLYDADVMERYWITQALRVRMPLGRVDTLTHHPSVVYIQRDFTGAPPPSYTPDSNGNNDIGAARTYLVSDRLRDNPLFTNGWVSILDTGVRTTHELFKGTTSPFLSVGDCVDGEIDCTGGTVPLDVSVEGHGTASAAILAGTGGEGTSHIATHQGVTTAQVDAFRVYRSSTSSPEGEFVGSAGLRGLQSATALLDRVIVCEIQDYTSSEASALCDAADAAQGAGAVVVAANGNFTGVPLGVPASARRVLGIGAIDVQFGTTTASQSYGRTTDGRNKPDLQARTATESAGNASDDDVYFLGGTSGAVPYAGGAAALIRNWMEYWRGGPVDPGQVAAHMILAGSLDSPFSADSRYGAGEIQLPSDGWAYFGKVEVSEAYPEVKVPLVIHWPDIANVEVALWWPETTRLTEDGVANTHNDIELELLDDAGTPVAKGNTPQSVFERARAAVTTSSGTWTLRIYRKSLNDSPQTVFWMAAMLR